MPSIRPISDLRNIANEISDFCKQTREPVSSQETAPAIWSCRAWQNMNASRR